MDAARFKSGQGMLERDMFGQFAEYRASTMLLSTESASAAPSASPCMASIPAAALFFSQGTYDGA